MMLIAEAWGKTEDEMKLPLAGESGKELWRMLGEAAHDRIAPELHQAAVDKFKYGELWLREREPWLEAASMLYTNVLAFRPPDNKFDALCLSKKELPPGYSAPAVERGKYLAPQYLCEVDRLWSEIEQCQPNLLVLLGAKACWAVLGQSDIGKLRGSVAQVERNGRVYKVLPTYHPASLFRTWSWRPIVVVDLMKAFYEAEFPDVRRRARKILVDPTLAEVERWVTETLAAPPPHLGTDTETYGGQISMISFARSPVDVISIPFLDERKSGWNYWPTRDEEVSAWRLVERLLNSPIPKLFQNGLYDYQYILPMGLRCSALTDDLMLLHHSLFPEMRKSLAFLASVYVNEPTWKQMRLQKPDTEKRDE